MSEILTYSAPPRDPRIRWRRIALFVAVAMLLFVGLYAVHLATPQVDYLIERRGVLAKHDVVITETELGTNEDIRLESSSGLVVELRVMRPTGERNLPALVMLGGHDTGKDAVDLVGAPQGVAYVAPDYPYFADHHPEGFLASLAIVDDVQRAFLDSPPALSLILDWLLQQSWVDRDRVELVGVSLGVPFAAPAGALDDRYSRVWLMHGGGDNLTWVSHAGRKNIANETLRRVVARLALLLVYGNTFDTVRWIEETAPRPVILVMARDDDYVPREAQQPLIEASSAEHVELIWTEGLHIGPKRTFELQQLLHTVLSEVK